MKVIVGYGVGVLEKICKCRGVGITFTLIICRFLTFFDELINLFFLTIFLFNNENMLPTELINQISSHMISYSVFI